jgi:hypothetical protein
LERVTGTNLNRYVNEVLMLTKEDVPLLSGVNCVLELGIANTAELTQHGGLIDVVKVGDSSYAWNGSAWIVG